MLKRPDPPAFGRPDFLLDMIETIAKKERGIESVEGPLGRPSWPFWIVVFARIASTSLGRPGQKRRFDLLPVT
jgi:hypothetical protein